VRKEVQAELDVEDELREGDADKDPGLTAQTFASFVSYVRVILPVKDELDTILI
jgi:hypothetical protein